MMIFSKKKKNKVCNHVWGKDYCLICGIKKSKVIKVTKVIDKNTEQTDDKRVPESKLKNEKFYYEVIPFDEKYGLKKKRIRKERKLFRKERESVVLVRMEMSNGLYREFLVPEKSDGFVYKRRRYVFDPALKYYLIDRNIWSYDFAELLSIPLKKRYNISDKLDKLLNPEIERGMKRPLNPHIDINEVKTLIENSEIVDVEASINPTTLKRFTDSEVIKQVLQGAMLGRIFKIMFILIIVIAIFMLILILIQLYTSGIFEKIGGMF